MANHKKARHPAARGHCSMCKPWKDGHVARGSEAFEGHSNRVRRLAADESGTDEGGKDDGD